MIGGGTAFSAGSIYLALRSIVARRQLDPARYRGPSVLLLLLMALAAATAAQIPFALEIAAIIEGRGASAIATLVVLTSLQVALLVAVVTFVAAPRALAGAPPLDGGRPLRNTLIGLGLGLGAWPVVTAISLLVFLLFSLLGVELAGQPIGVVISTIEPIIAIAAIVVVAPIAEEIFFRGVVYAAWRREYGPRRALVGSTVLFALVHLSILATVPILVLGAALALVYERTRSLLAAMVAHATFNAISVGIAYYVPPGGFQPPT